MKLVGAISTAVLSLTLGVPATAYAQQEQHNQQEEQKDKPGQEKDKKAQPEQPAKQEQKSAKMQEKNKPEEKNAQQHTQQAGTEQKDQQPRGHGGGRIPDDRFRANFGQEHRFRVSQGDYSNRRFQYGGYWFGFVDAWPGNWQYTQDVFVVEINGVYYLCNPNYPGVNIALTVTM